MRPIAVLMVDDEMMLHQLTHEMLAHRGIRLWHAYDTREADQILQQKQIDVILCDVQMTPETGIEYSRRLVDSGVDKPLILISGLASPVAMTGVAAYLIKPFGIDQIYQKIMEVLAQTPA
jgi:CheY-like chemotaxis protein